MLPSDAHQRSGEDISKNSLQETVRSGVRKSEFSDSFGNGLTNSRRKGEENDSEMVGNFDQRHGVVSARTISAEMFNKSLPPGTGYSSRRDWDENDYGCAGDLADTERSWQCF